MSEQTTQTQQANESAAERAVTVRGSLAQVLSDNLGKQVVCEFLIGTTTLAEKRGTLVAVGDDTLALYDENAKTYILCDARGLRFVTLSEAAATTLPLEAEDQPSAPQASASAIRPASAQAAFNYAKRKARR